MLKLHDPFDKRIDYWSLGAMLHQMIVGKLPFAGKHFLEIASKILHTEVNFKLEAYNGPSLEVLDLIDQLLSKKPGQRLNTREIL